MSAPAIVVDDVSKRFRLFTQRASTLKELVTKGRVQRYEEKWALTNVSLEVPEGSVYGLIGHNGSGKSSLLRIMAGIHKPTSGAVRANGRISALLELGAGFHPDLTGRENVYLNAAILGIPKREVDGLIDEIVDFSQIEELAPGAIDSPVKHYSSGMFVRLGFSVSVHVNPQILLIDEVIAVGDEEFQRRCFEHIYKLKHQGVTIVMVTHSLGVVQNMCDRAAWLDHGVLQIEGRAPDVVHRYLTAVNAAEAERLESEAESLLAAARFQEATPGQDTFDPHHPWESITARPVLIDKVEFLDGEGTSTLVATTGDPLTVRVHLSCQQPTPHPLVSFAVENADGVFVANPLLPKPRDPSAAPVFDGNGHVDYVVDHLPLGPGTYNFSFATHDVDGMVCFDKKERLLTLRVQPGEKPVQGLIELMGSWGEIDVPRAPGGAVARQGAATEEVP